MRNKDIKYRQDILQSVRDIITAHGEVLVANKKLDGAIDKALEIIKEDLKC